MGRKRWIALWAATVLVAAGCGKATSTNETAAAKTDAAPAKTAAPSPGDAPAKESILREAAKSDGPAASVFDFLEAVRTGDDAKGLMMLTKLAREKNQKTFGPSASDTASFQVGKVEYKAEDLAAVSAVWNDLNRDGQKATQEYVWMVRREPEGWRVGGVAATVFPGKPPILLNFEDPEDMKRQLDLLNEELDRIDQEKELQAQGQPAPNAQPLRR